MNDLELAKIEQRIYSVRGMRVILDADLAGLYGVSTKAFNQAVKRNLARFPEDFMFRLSKREVDAIQFSRSQNVTASPPSRSMRSQNVTASKRNVRYRPYAFTEHGALQAANVLNSANAIHMSVFVIRAFVKMREHLATNAAILKRLAEIDQGLLLHDSALRDIYQKLLPLLSPPADPPRRRIGFR
jgi:ORF6N domain-containing protein